MIERWRVVVGFSLYEISSLGRVRRVGGKVLKATLIRGRYGSVSLRRDGQTFKRLAHRLAAEAFGSLPPGSKKEIDHRRGVVASRAEILHGARGHTDHTSRFKGVSFSARSRRWLACITDGSNGRARPLGLFDDEVEAAKAYERAALAQWGTCFLNFPGDKK